ncbi:ABC transporter substrate-binding protein [Xylanimonas protaetiae]|uniref:Extracellular solute-binding protein n=1 Tax=Xylanimonas protaetiae TaxID=2509457 RepID=A0A4P6F831_9MICO|nr:extracellular solute-binding protein [Xylanimonas protaetiae]QAY71646.1 extracellular solute-binding protein [Xylanimonas protaetiae]
MKLRQAKAVAVAAVGTLALTACAQGNAGGASDVEFGGDLEATELTVMGFADPDEIGQVRWDRAADAIAPATIRPGEGGFDIQAFLAARSAGNVPDLVYFNRADFTGTLASLGALMPLDQCIEGEGIDFDQLRDPAVAQVTFNDQVFGVPEFGQVQLVMSNTDLLTAAGLTPADIDGSDWESITAAVGDITVHDGRLDVIGYHMSLPGFFPLYVASNGGQLMSDDGRTATIDSPEVVETLEWIMDLIDKQGGWGEVHSFIEASDRWGEGNLIATDTAGALVEEQWYLNVLMNNTPDIPINATPFHSRATGEPIALSTGLTWAIPVGAQNPQAACRFIATMVHTDSWMAAAQTRYDRVTAEGNAFTGLLTGNAVADRMIRDEFVTGTGSEAWDRSIDAMYEASEHLFFIPPTPADQEFRAAWFDAVNRVLAGNMSIEESLARGQREGQRALDDGWARAEGLGD